jgi:hypothetical protein
MPEFDPLHQPGDDDAHWWVDGTAGTVEVLKPASVAG